VRSLKQNYVADWSEKGILPGVGRIFRETSKWAMEMLLPKLSPNS
jgi:hypothetical protein